MIPNEYFDSFHTQKYRNPNPVQRALIRRFMEKLCLLFIEAQPVHSVLEIGVGEGFVSGFLSERFPDKQFTGVDLRADDLKLLRQRFPRIEAHVGDVYDLSFLPGPFDLVICAEVLEHLDEPERGLAQICALQPRRAIFTVPHEPWFMLSNLLRGKNVTRFGNDIEHVNHFGPESLRRLLQTRFAVLRQTRSYPWLLALCA